MNLVRLCEAKKIIDKFLKDKIRIEFRCNFPVYHIEDYINFLVGEWNDCESNNSGSCHDLWFYYNDFTLQVCSYHGDVELYTNNKED